MLCSSVSLERNADLYIFIDEKNYLQTYVFQNMDVMCVDEEINLGNLSFGKIW